VLPLAISTGAGSASRHSIGTGVIGGMIAATALAIFLFRSSSVSLPATTGHRPLICRRHQASRIPANLAKLSPRDNSETSPAYAVPSGKWLEFGVAHSRVKMKVSFQAARSIG
jgi:hypothetical protein